MPKLDLSAGLVAAINDHMSHLVEVLLSEHFPDGDREQQEAAVQHFEAGVRHLADIHDIAIDVMSKL